MRLERIQITVFLAVAVCIWVTVSWAQRAPLTLDHAKPFSSVVSALVLFAVAFELRLWRIRLLHGWFVKRPDLRGTWEIELKSSFITPETNESLPVVICYMGVHQTLSTLRMHLMTEESESWLIADHIQQSPNTGGYQVVGVYTNEPDVHLRGDRVSEIHYGAMVIETHGGFRPETCTAKYWTDRKTTGTMDFLRREDKVHTRFRDAQDAFSS